MRKLLHSSVIIVLAIVGLSSCETSVNYTPYIAFSSFLKNPVWKGDTIVGCEDTVMVAYDALRNVYMLDTISKTDTVVFTVKWASRGNNLIQAKIDIDTTALAMKCLINDEIRNILATTSSEKDMRFDFKTGYQEVCFPIVYSPKKLGSHEMSFTVTTDSKFSPVGCTIYQYVEE